MLSELNSVAILDVPANALSQLYSMQMQIHILSLF